MIGSGSQVKYRKLLKFEDKDVSILDGQVGMGLIKLKKKFPSPKPKGSGLGRMIVLSLTITYKMADFVVFLY